MFEEKFYRYKIESLNHLIDLTIETSYREHPSVYFQIHEMSYHHMTMFWRTGFPDRKFIKIAVEANRMIQPEKSLSLEEIVRTKEYSELMYQKSPIFHQTLDANQTQIVRQVLNSDMDKNIRLPGGRDGHSYEITIYQPQCKKIQCWCYLPSEWKELGIFINSLVDVAGLDRIYCAKISAFWEGKLI